MLDIRIKVDTKTVERRLAHVEKQIPFAIASALTKTAWDARKKLASDLPHIFQTRSKWLDKGSAEEGGLRVEKATKTTLMAEVGSRDPFMVEQTFGGLRRHKQKTQAIPLVGKGRPRATSKSMTRPSRWPGVLLKNGKTFIGDPFKSGKQGVWARFKPTKRKKGWVRLLYNLQDKVEIPKRWPLEKTVRVVVGKVWDDNVIRAIKHAIDTAR